MRVKLCAVLFLLVFAGQFVLAGDGATATGSSLPQRTPPYLPPLTLWGDATAVDEPESVYYSVGRTPRHFGHNAELIDKFLDFLREKQVAPGSLLVKNVEPPKEMRRILVDPELLTNCSWTVRGDWIVNGGGRWGPGTCVPVRIDRAGWYRIWIRYMGYKEGLAVTDFQVLAAGKDILSDQFHGRVAGADGPQWHDLMVYLGAGDYQLGFEHVERLYQAPANAPWREHQVDCIYLTDELWREVPSDKELTDLRARVPAAAAQRTETPALPDDQKQLWTSWQVHPSDWETARANPRLFELSYEFWRREIAAVAEADYFAPPRDPVAGGIADYRDPRRQVIFDPIWNMVANPYRIRTQREILEKDIDPLAKDAFYDWIMPGYFPVVVGQWNREGGGLSAWDAATWGHAAGVYTVPRAGTWHLWVQFKNINYFEYFGVYADTIMGRAAKWERTERLYPGGRMAWAKVGTIEVPRLTEAEKAAHLASAARGVFVERGVPVFAVTNGEWQTGQGFITGSGTACRVTARCTLKPAGDFHLRARLAVTGLAGSGAAVFFRNANGINFIKGDGDDNTVCLEGYTWGAVLGTGTTFRTDGAISDGTPFDIDVIREGGRMRVLLNQAQVADFACTNTPGAMFGLRAGKASLRLYDFAASGDMDNGLDALRQLTIGLWMDKYINARTYRGVYALFITDDADYKPEGQVQPKASMGRYFSQMESCGFATNRGYVLNAAPGIGLISQAWMPGPEPKEPVIELSMARDTVRSASLMFRSGESGPITLKITPGPLTRGWKSYRDAVRWRVVAFAPYGNGREEWSPFFLLRRPFLMLPPLGSAQAWLTVDSTGIPPGTYESCVSVECGGNEEGRTFARRTVRLRVRVADVRVEPETPILVHGWVVPPPGEENLRDWFKRFNVWQGPFFTRAEMDKYGLKQQIYCLRNADTNEVRRQIALAKSKGLGYDDWMFSVMDEPCGQTAAELGAYLSMAGMIRSADPKVKITMNPGEAARAATFSILQPYVDLWNPYALHLSYGPSGRDYLKKPWIWYTTPCYGDKAPAMASEIYEQVRSVLRQPGDCRGTAFFAPYYPGRDPWDTAYEHIRDNSVFVLYSRHGPVATPTWEALREAVQHANLARMVRERAAPDDVQAKALWENGGVEAILAWLEKHPAYHSRHKEQE